MRAVAKDLDPHSTNRELVLEALQPADVSKLLEESHVRSHYQVFAMCVGLGNYRARELPGADASAHRVALRLRQIAGGDHVAHV